MRTNATEVRQERTFRSMLALAFAIASIVLVAPAAYAATTSTAHAPAARTTTSTSNAAQPNHLNWRQPTCRVYVGSVLGVGSGGCDGYGGPGQDRMVVQCNGYRGTVVYMYGAWMNRWQSWQYNVWCPGGYGYHAAAAWFQHQG
jgi:hypothetical protein